MIHSTQASGPRRVTAQVPKPQDLEPQTYPFSAYDRNLCLKMNAAMWAVLAFLLRPYVIVVASISNRADRTGIVHTFYPDKTALALSALAAIPAMVLVYAWLMRQSAVQGLPRRIWHRGRDIMLVISLVNIPVLVGPAVLAGSMLTPGIVLQLAGCALLIWYLVRSQRVVDTFEDYPG